MTTVASSRQAFVQRLALVGGLAILPSFVFAGIRQTQTLSGVTVSDSLNIAGLLIVAVALHLVLPVIFRHNILGRLDATPTPVPVRLGAAVLAAACVGQGVISLGLI